MYPFRKPRLRRGWIVLFIFGLLFLGRNARAQEMVSAEQFEQWKTEISNWGRWGPEDEKGTLNLITNEKRIRAARLVREGVTISLALDLDKDPDSLQFSIPLQHSLATGTWMGHETAGDTFIITYHGWSISHIDGLTHFTQKGKMYNDFPTTFLKESGAERLGVHNMADGIFTRGILIDMPWFFDVDYLEPGRAYTAADLEAWEEKTGIEIESGDALLIRTGRWERVRQRGHWSVLDSLAGAHASVAKWLRQKDVAILGCDAVSDVVPSGVEGKGNPLHELVLVSLGMPLLDNLDLDRLALEARTRNRWEFLFVGAPLRINGGTGSPLNPLAMF